MNLLACSIKPQSTAVHKFTKNVTFGVVEILTAVVASCFQAGILIGLLNCGSLPWEPPTGYQISNEVTVTQIGIQATTQ
jgi:hypothetical protein